VSGHTFIVRMSKLLLVVALGLIAPECCGQDADRNAAIVPNREVIHPFNGKDLTGLTTWLQTTGAEDPAREYRATDGMLHVDGRGMGYLATVDSYRNYHLSVEYKWGQRTDGSGNVRNSGILLHATGPPGNTRGVWMASVECQLAQGCEGDIICIRGNDEDGNTIPVSFSSDTRIAADGRTRWQPGGAKTPYIGKQFWWSNHEVGFRERLDTRGADDVASPPGEWTKVECICDGDRITIKINGTIVNECYDVYPTAGRILLENEKNEILFLNLEVRPLKHHDPRAHAEETKRHSAEP
jgi:hypothetical protein